MSQNRKRPHDQTSSQPNNGEVSGNVSQQNGGSGSNDSSPLSKRTLMSASTNNTNSNNVAQNSKNNSTGINNLKTTPNATATTTTGTTSNTTVTKQAFRASQKSNKPTQAINRVNSPEDIYYQINTHLNQLRHEVQIVALRKLARKPYKLLANEYQALYQTFGKLSEKAAANSKTAKGKVNDVEMSGDEKNKDTDECMLVVEGDEKTNENSNDKNDLVVDEEGVDESKKSNGVTPAPEVVID